MKIKKRSTLLIISMLMLIVCSILSCDTSSSDSKQIDGITKDGNFNIQVNPKKSMRSSLEVETYTVTALDITVSKVSSGTVTATFNWAAADGATTYSIDMGEMGEYKIEVSETSVNDDDPADENIKQYSTTVNIQPMKVTVVTIVPGGSMDIKIDDDNSGPTGGPFSENFDTTPIGQIPDDFSLVKDPVDTYVGVVNSEVTPFSLPNCLKIVDNSNTAGVFLTRKFGNQPYGQLTVYFYLDNASRMATFGLINTIGLVFDNYNNVKEIRLRLPDGSTEQWISIGSFAADQWNKVTLKWDANNFKYQVFLNDTDLGVYPFFQEEIPCVFTVQTPESGIWFYLDDISLTLNPEVIE